MPSMCTLSVTRPPPMARRLSGRNITARVLTPVPGWVGEHDDFGQWYFLAYTELGLAMTGYQAALAAPRLTSHRHGPRDVYRDERNCHDESVFRNNELDEGRIALLKQWRRSWSSQESGAGRWSHHARADAGPAGVPMCCRQ